MPVKQSKTLYEQSVFLEDALLRFWQQSGQKFISKLKFKIGTYLRKGSRQSEMNINLRLHPEQTAKFTKKLYFQMFQNN